MYILIIGGDRRMNMAKYELENYGYTVKTLGLSNEENGTLENADVILLPVPTTRDGKTVFCPQSDKIIPLESIDNVKKDTLVLSCGYDFEKVNSINYLNLDSFSLLNAVPTAEGAIAKAINDVPFCLWQSRILVIGYGRVAKILAERLSAFKCDLTVSARKSTDFALLDTLNIKRIHTYNVAENAKNFDIIFNTIDVEIFDEKDFENLKNLYLYDLSTKGCINFEKAQAFGINAEKLPGLPGKTAPKTAAKIIAQTANQLIGEWLCKN